jgi:hypothetical protein
MSKKTALIILMMSFIIFNYISFGFNKYIKNKRNNDTSEKEISEMDSEAPVLTLKENKFIIYEGIDFNYSSFVVSAIDNVDGDITNKVKFNTIDTSQIGAYEIEYSVEDNAGNKTSKILELIVKEDVGLQNE